MGIIHTHMCYWYHTWRCTTKITQYAFSPHYGKASRSDHSQYISIRQTRVSTLYYV